MPSGSLLRGLSGSTLPRSMAAPRVCVRRFVLTSPPRAGGGGDSEPKSWGEIAAEAVEVVKDVARKVGSGASDALQALVPRSSEPKPKLQRGTRDKHSERRVSEVVGPFGGGGGGLLGGLLGGLAGAAARGLAETLAAGAAEGAGAAERAAAAIVADARVTAALGRVSVGPPMSQAISSSSVNGVTTRRVSLLLPLLDGAGAVVAQARVDEEEGGRGSSSRSARIVVTLPGGDSITVGSGGGGRAGGTNNTNSSSTVGEIIDAEFRDLPK